jgi:hypothetical protein
MVLFGFQAHNFWGKVRFQQKPSYGSPGYSLLPARFGERKEMSQQPFPQLPSANLLLPMGEKGLLPVSLCPLMRASSRDRECLWKLLLWKALVVVPGSLYEAARVPEKGELGMPMEGLFILQVLCKKKLTQVQFIMLEHLRSWNHPFVHEKHCLSVWL